MKDKFEQWYESTWGSKPEDTDESNKAFNAWQACKQEILKTLKNDQFHIWVENQSGELFESIDLKAIDLIKKL